MNKIRYSIVLVLLALLIAPAVGSPSAVLAAEATPPPPPSMYPEVPHCADMPEAQLPGTNPGSACRISVAPSGQVLPMLSYGRTGSTSRYTSVSSSSLIENQIKVQGFLWMWWPGPQLWQLEDGPCENAPYNASYAACRTYGGTPGYQMGQEGYHYWINSTYGNESLETWDWWWF